jgi:hypothetical protein
MRLLFEVEYEYQITVSLKSDEKTTMKLITDIHTQLRTANALKLSYSALTKAP